MKNVACIILILALLTTFSCTRPKVENEPKLNVQYSETVTQVYGFKPKFRFKHDCVGPFGVCLIFNFKPFELDAEELESPTEYGYAQVGIDNGQLHIIFEQDVALWSESENKYIIPIYEDFFLDPISAAILGYESIEILENDYEVSFDVFEDYGEVFLDVNLTNHDVPTTYDRYKAKFRYTGLDCGSCECMYGICAEEGITDGTINAQEYNQGFGYLRMAVDPSGDYLHIIFERPAGNSEDEITISDNFELDEELVYAMTGQTYTQLTLLEGVYEIQYNNYESFGEAFVDITLDY
jgi:hypothetical protein